MFGKKKDEFAAEAPKPSFTGTHIAEGVEMRGDFTTTDPIIIDGTLIGDIESSNVVIYAFIIGLCSLIFFKYNKINFNNPQILNNKFPSSKNGSGFLCMAFWIGTYS